MKAFSTPGPERETHTEGVGGGHVVIIQHCEYKDPKTGFYCNDYLGVEYPSIYCPKHKKEKK